MSKPIKASEITPEALYNSRRRFIKDSLKIAASSLLLGACQPKNTTRQPNADSILKKSCPSFHCRRQQHG